MKVNSLKMDNITRYKSATMDFPNKISVIQGFNGDGKTTIVDIIRYLLTKNCFPRTDKAGRGAEKLVRTGARVGEASMSLSANGSDPLTIGRKIPGELWIDGRSGNATILQKGICDYLAVEIPVLSAATSTSAMLEMKPQERKELFFGLMGLSFERDALLEKIKDELSRNARAVEEACELIHDAPLDLFTGGADTFKKLYDHFYTKRRDANRDLKNLGEPPAPHLIDEPLQLEEKVTHLQELRGLKAGLERKISATTATEGARLRLIAEIGKLEDRLREAGGPEAAATEYDTLVGSIGPLESKQDALKLQKKTFTDVAAKLEQSGKTCALGSEEAPVECSMTKAKREKIVADYRERAEAADKEWFEIKAELEPMELRRRELIPLKNMPSRAAIEAEIESKQADINALPSADFDLKATDDEIATLTERIRKGEEVIAEANRESGVRQELEKQQAKRAELEQSAEALNALVEVLSAKGLPGQILDQAKGPIEKRANERLSKLTGGRYQLHLQVDPDFDIIVDHDGASAPLDNLSTSEQYRVGMILQDAIVHLSGLRFLVIDQMDVLDPINSELCMDALLSMADDYDQILVLRTLSRGDVKNPHIPDVGFYLLEDGQLREVA